MSGIGPSLQQFNLILILILNSHQKMQDLLNDKLFPFR